MKIHPGINRLLAGALALAASSTALAHVSYTGRDFIANGSFDGVATWTLSNQRVTSAFGWADATDLDWADSHRGRFTRFTLDREQIVTIKVWQQDDVPFVAQGRPMTALNDLVPGFSLYSGLSPRAGHDGSDHPLFLANHPGYLPSVRFFDGIHVGDKEGAWRALDDFWIGNSEAEVPPDQWSASKLSFIGASVDGAGVDFNGDSTLDYIGDANADGMTSATFILGPGTYSVVVGGGCYGCQFGDAATLLSQRGFSASITVTPEPATWAAMLGGLAALGFAARRRVGR
jgi:hypothetical protein